MVMHRGRMTALLEKDEISQENIMKAAMGVQM
jgi:ribose transport system ATP-binding protein